MKRVILLAAVILSILQASSVFADNKIEEYCYDYNDGSIDKVIRYQNTVGSIRNQNVYNGYMLTIKDREDNPDDKYVEMNFGETSDAQFLQLFPEVLYGKVVVEADLKMNNLTPSRRLFEVFSHDEQGAFYLQMQGYEYSMYYERTNPAVFDIPIDNEWHHYRAILDTDKDLVNMYIDGVPCFSEPVIMNRGANAKKGISGFKSTITFDVKRGDVEGTTGIDNVKAYTLSKEKYTSYYSDELEIDYDYNMISGVRKGMTVGEVLDRIKFKDSDATAVICDGGKEKQANDYVYACDELIITKGNQREFITIHLDNSDAAEYFIMENSPEILHGGERLQFDDDNANITPISKNGELFVPVKIIKDIFGGTVKINRDTGYTAITKDDKTLRFNADDKNSFTENETVYYNIKALFEYFSVPCNIGSDGLVMFGKGDFQFKGKREREYIINSFVMRKPNENAVIINAGNDINGAIKKAGELLNDSDVIINLGSNVYNITETICLTEDITANKNHRLFIRGNEDNHAKITGGITLTEKDFQKIPDSASIKKRLPEISADKIVMINLKNKGITDLGEITPQGHTFEIKPSEIQFFVNGSLQTMARYPNEGFIYTGKVLHGGYGNPSVGYGDNEFEYTDKRVENWLIDDNVWMFGFWNNEYTNSQVRLRKLVKERSSIIADGPLRGTMTKGDRPYFYFNVLEELDKEGEYYIDFNSGYLYYYPKKDFVESEIYISTTKNILLELDRTENVVIENVDFGYCRDIAIKQIECKNTLLRNCSFRGIGTYAVQQRYCVNSGLYGCDIYETGAHSVMLEGGCMYTLTDSDNFVINCSFREMGTRRRTYSGAVLSRGSGNYIYRNSFRDGYHMGIYVFGTNHTMKYNSFSNMCYMSGDAGCIYMASYYYTANIKSIGNYFENMSPHPEVGAGGNVSIYYDNSTSHTLTYGNIMYDTVLGYQSNCGRQNKVFGNIMSDLKMKAGILGAATNDSFVATYDTLRMTAYKSKVWEKLMPQMRDLEYNYNPREPYGTDAYNNIWENTVEFTATKPKITKVYDNIANIEAENGSIFMDKDNKDFRLKDQSHFNNTYIMGDVEYSLMGTGQDFVFGNNADLERVFIGTDVSASNRANVLINKGDAVSLYVLARDVEGNVIDKDKLSISYSSEGDAVAVSQKGVIYGKENGKGTVNVTVSYKGKAITSKLNVYTDETEWNKVDIALSERPVSVYYNDELLELQNKCDVETGMLIMPSEEVLGKLGYTQTKANDKYIFTKDASTIEFKVGDDKFIFNAKEYPMVTKSYLKEGILYIPFTVFEDMGILNIYNDAEKIAHIYNVNLAGGDEKIPEGVELVKLSDLISDTDNWTKDQTAKYVNTGSEVTFGQDSADTSKVQVLGYKGKKMPNNTMLDLECEWKSDTFISFNFRISNPAVIPWRASENSYYILVKPDSIELQKRVNSTTVFMIDNVPNNYLKPGTPHKVTMGIIDTEDGPRAIVNADGHNIIDVVDKINYSVSGTTRTIVDPLDKITEEGYISFVCYSSTNGEGSAYFKLR